MSFRSKMGLDAIDVVIHFAITAVVLAGFFGTGLNGEDAAVVGSMVTTGSLVLLAVRRGLGLRQMRREELGTGEGSAVQLADLEQRIADLEAAQARVYELEERLDFTERMLARETEHRALSPGEAKAP
jgi:hypothetical protein